MKGDGQYLGCLEIEAACLAFDLTITVIPVSAVQVPTKHGSGQFAFCLWYSGSHYDLLLPTAGAYPLAVSSVQNFGGKSGSGDADGDEELDALTIYTTATGGGRKPRPKRPAPILAETRSGQHFGMVVHPGKIASFGTSARVRRRLEVHRELLGMPCTSFKLLGIHYSVATNRTAPEIEALTEVIQLRCERVAKLAKAPAMRRTLLRSTVLSLFQWAGPWQRYAKSQLSKWTSAIEVVGRLASQNALQVVRLRRS